MKQIKFTATGCCSALGNFSVGDTARVADDVADHLVNEARCAAFVDSPVKPDEEPKREPVKPRGRK